MIEIVYGMQRPMALSSVWGDSLFDAHHRAMSPGAIGGLISQYADELESRMEEESKALTAVSVKEVDLEEWAFEIIVSSLPHP